MNKSIDDAMSYHVAARIDTMRFSGIAPSAMEDEVLQECFNLFSKHIESINDFILEIDEYEALDKLIGTKQLIHQYYIVPIMAEMVQRQTHAK